MRWDYNIGIKVAYLYIKVKKINSYSKEVTFFLTVVSMRK
jgi:hypothetical protein